MLHLNIILIKNLILVIININIYLAVSVFILFLVCLYYFYVHNANSNFYYKCLPHVRSAYLFFKNFVEIDLRACEDSQTRSKMFLR
jgi:hypothetical protein